MDNSLVQLVKAVSDVLERHAAKYAITGSVASSLHGEPVTSADVDYIVQMNTAQVQPVFEDLRDRYYVSEEGLREAVMNHGMTNVIYGEAGISADLSMVELSPFIRKVFERRVSRDLDPGGFRAWFVSPEDVILMKLLWRKDSRSQKQWENALGVVRVRGATLDWKYLFEQGRTLDIEQDLIALRDEGGV